MLARAGLALAALCLPASARSQGLTIGDEATRSLLLPIIERSNPLIEFRRSQLQAAQARAQGAGLAQPMALSAEVEEVPDGWALGRAGSTRLDLSREIIPGLRPAQRALAQLDVDRAQLELELTERLVVSRALRHLVQARVGFAIAARLGAEDSLLAGAEQVVAGRFAVNDARYVDVLRLRTERLRVQSERATTLTDARTGRARLVADLAPSDTLRAEIERLVDSLIVTSARGLEQQPVPLASLDVLLAEFGVARRTALIVDRAEQARRVARAERRPLLFTSLGVQRFEGGSGHTVGPTIGVSVTLPFTAGRANTASDRAAERLVVAAQASARATLGTVRAEAAAARDRYETVRVRLALYDADLLRSAGDQRESALAAYRSGDLSLLELLDFERALARVEIDRLRTEIDAAEAVADLVAALVGGGVGSEQEEAL
jgi:outer membrane protein TolC